VEGNAPHRGHRRVCEGDGVHVGLSHGMVEVKLFLCSCQHYDTYVDLHVKYLVFLSDFNQIWIFLTDFHKSLRIKLHENLSGGSRAFTCRQMGRWTDMTNLIGSFCENT